MSLFSGLSILEDAVWLYVGIPILMSYGLYLSYKSKFLQIIKFPSIFKTFFSFLTHEEKSDRGVNPVHIFFAAVGGCVGIGNVISVCSAVKIGGPGAVFWMWIAALFGMIVKYAEIFLSVKFRQNDGKRDYIGGPIIFLKKIAGGEYISKFVAFLLCLYGVEIYLFRIVAYSVSTNWSINYTIVVFVLLTMILGAMQGGLRLVGKVSTVVVPIFLFMFAGMSVWVFIQNWLELPAVFSLIFKSAFSYHAALGGFAGSSMWLAMSHGVRRACYTGDIGIGYSGTIHASTSEKNPAREAIFGVMSIVLDTFIICTLSVLLVLVTGTWNAGIHEEQMVVAALSKYFSHVDIIWPLFIFLLGYSTLIAFFAAGRKSAQSLSKKYGAPIFTLLGSISFIIFSYVGSEEHCLTVMSLVGVTLLIVNVYGMWKLSHHINYDIEAKECNK
jgi:alanine or glycine:cation symporter, AGCS family